MVFLDCKLDVKTGERSVAEYQHRMGRVPGIQLGHRIGKALERTFWSIRENAETNCLGAKFFD